MPRRQTINMAGTHFLKHRLHDLDALNPTSYKYLEQKNIVKKEVDKNLMLILKASAEHYVQNAKRFKSGLKEENK